MMMTKRLKVDCGARQDVEKERGEEETER